MQNTNKKNSEYKALLFSRKSLVSFSLLIVIVTLIGIEQIGKITIGWDDGNLIYDSWRLCFGQVPNVDFVSGYPGGHQIIISSLFNLLGPSVTSYHIGLVFFNTLLAATVFLLSIRFVGPFYSLAAGILASLLGPLESFVSWTFNPGHILQVLVILTLGSILVWVKRKGSDLKYLVIAGLIAGFSLSFKQTAVFSSVALLAIVSLRYVMLAGMEKSRKKLIFALPNLVVFLIYCLLRLKVATLSTFLDKLSFFLVPWLSANIFITLCAIQSECGLPSESESLSKLLSDYMKDLLILGCSVLVGSLPIVIWYTANNANIFHVIYRILIQFTKLVDRAQFEIAIPIEKFVLGWVVLFGIPVVGVIIGRLKPWFQKLFVWSGWFAVSVLTGITATWIIMKELNLIPIEIWRKVGVFCYRWINFQAVFLGWGVIPFFPVVFIIAWVFLRHIKNKEQEQRENLEATTIILAISMFGAITSTIMFPWPRSYYFTGIFIVSYIAITSIVFRLTSKNFVRNIKAWATPLTAIILVFVFLNYKIKIDVLGRQRFKVDQERYKGDVTIRVKPFVDVVEKLKQLPPNDSVAGFPNLAFSLFLAGKKPLIHQGNYFGNTKEDLHVLIDEILSKKIDWLIVNKNCYPMGPVNPFFPLSETTAFFQMLDKHYTLAYTVPCPSAYFDFYKRLYNVTS